MLWRVQHGTTYHQEPQTKTPEARTVGTRARLLSLDMFRGGTIAAMIAVNNNGSPHAYPQLLHAKWDGWTFTDLVFPFFLWIVGVAITLALGSRLERGTSRASLLLQVSKRAAIIFAVGLFLNGFPYFDLGTIRIPGVLQRIAICYLIAATIFLFLGVRGRVASTLAVLALYWVLMMAVPVPGYGTGSFEMEGNFSRYVDGLFLSGHMYSQTKTWDPEGIVSTLPAIATTMFGIFAGMVLRTAQSAERKAVWLFFAGNLMVLAGLMLSTWMPINKQLWTVSYSVFVGGLAAVVFASCYWLVDVLHWRRFATPFAIYGVNALAVYVLSGLFARTLGLIRVGDVSLRTWIWRKGFEPLASPANASLLFSLAHVLLFFLIAWVMYRRGWIIRA